MYTVCDDVVTLNDGFTICITNSATHASVIRDLNLNRISDKMHMSEFKYNRLELRNKLCLYNDDVNENGMPNLVHVGFTYKPSDIKFEEYEFLYVKQQSLFDTEFVDYHYHKIPKNIAVMMKHTNLLKKHVKENCLMMISVLLHDIATIILPLTLELVRLDYNLYDYIK